MFSAGLACVQLYQWLPSRRDRAWSSRAINGWAWQLAVLEHVATSHRRQIDASARGFVFGNGIAYQPGNDRSVSLGGSIGERNHRFRLRRTIMAASVSLTKKVDLPPRGDRNSDPISDEAGAHPIETGIGAAVAGATTGLIAGAVAGPMAAAVGVAVGAVAGGYAGTRFGEVIDPTLNDDWLRERFPLRPYVLVGDEYEDFKSAYQFGGCAESKYGQSGLDLTDERLRIDWESNPGNELPWTRACEAVKDGYERSVQIRKERCCGAEEPVGDAEQGVDETIAPSSDATGTTAHEAESFKRHDEGIE
jgi:hypothetical protein